MLCFVRDISILRVSVKYGLNAPAGPNFVLGPELRRIE